MKKIIFWDLDDTLGSFENIGMPSEKNPARLRQGCESLLAECQFDEITNVITTRATANHAKRVVDAFGLEKYVAGVFHRAQVEGFSGKAYGAVLTMLGMNPAEATQSCIAVGNDFKDMPTDCSIPFVYDSSCQEDVVHLREVVLRLMQGEGTPSANFFKLFEESRRKSHPLKSRLSIGTGKSPTYFETAKGKPVGLGYVHRSYEGQRLEIPTAVLREVSCPAEFEISLL